MRVTERAKEIVAEVLEEGGLAVDATAGNGWDTLFLAECVGPGGQVIGFDVQEEAIASAQDKLQQAGVLDRVQLHLVGHERMGEYVSGEVGAVMFNLGYLPGSSKEQITRGATTIAALESSLALLKSGGVITIICYIGHEGGQDEAMEILRWIRTIGASFLVDGPDQVPEGDAPFLVVIRNQSW